jgi:hypothetical protein
VELPDGEPRFGPWRVRPIDDVVRGALQRVHADPGVPRRPALLAVDGRSGSGKTTVARHLAGRIPGAAVVHTGTVRERQRCANDNGARTARDPNDTWRFGIDPTRGPARG